MTDLAAVTGRAAGRSSTATMLAAVLVEPRNFRLDEVARPEPEPGQVRIRLEGSGVCASNLPPWQGKPWFQYPFAPGVPGHEGWGRIDAVGREVDGGWIGVRVAALSNRAYAEYDVADVGHIVPLPEALDGQPFPGEPLGCAFNVLHRSHIEPGQTVAIVGVGFLGALLTRLAAAAGARVIAISRRPYALRIARDCGAASTVTLEDHQATIAAVAELTGGVFCDRVIECTGYSWPLDLAGEITRERGTLVIAGYHQDGPRQINMQLWNWRGLDVVNAHERDPAEYLRGMREAVQAVASGAIDPAPLYTHEFTLEHLGDALDAMSKREDGFLKALVRT